MELKEKKQKCFYKLKSSLSVHMRSAVLIPPGIGEEIRYIHSIIGDEYVLIWL